MNTWSKRVAVVVILGLTVFAAISQMSFLNNGKATAMSDDEKTIRNMIETQYPGFVRSGDAKGYVSQFTNDALWMPPGENNRKGREAIAASLGAEFKVVQLNPVITVQEVSIFGDHAYAIGKDELTIHPKGESTESRVVYTVFWFLRKVDDKWKIARQIWNEKPMED